MSDWNFGIRNELVGDIEKTSIERQFGIMVRKLIDDPRVMESVRESDYDYLSLYMHIEAGRLPDVNDE